MVSTAEDVAPELRDLMASFVTHMNEQNRRSCAVADNSVPEEPGFSCRSWADIDQEIFRVVTLRSYDDVQVLLKLVNYPGSRIAGYIQELECEQSLAARVAAEGERPACAPPAWLHTVCTILQRKLVSLQNIRVRISGPLPQSRRSISGIHYQLPSESPSLSKGIQSLELNNLRFSSFNHLVRQLRMMLSLRSLQCRNLTWDGDQDESVTARGRPGVRSHSVHSQIDYSMTGCTYDGAAAWLSSLVSPDLASKLRSEDAEVFRNISSAILQHVDNAKYPGLCVRSSRQTDSIRFYAELEAQGNEDRHYLTPVVQAHLDPVDSDEEDLTPEKKGAARLLVGAISLQFLSTGLSVSEMLASEYDWAAFDELAASLDGLKMVLLAFESRDDMLLFHRKVVAPTMRHLGAKDSTKLAYVVWWPAQGAWVSFTESSVTGEFEDISGEKHEVPSALHALIPRLTKV